jgi:3-keto-disaccharide hydrolase
MRRQLFGLLLVAALAVPAQAEDKDGFQSLFNGKNLQGWKVYPSGTGNWKVQDGAIIGSGKASHLFTERGDYTDFHLRAQVNINDKGNSGMYFRTQFGPGFPKGYEAQINSTHPDPIKTGSLYPAFNRNLPKEKREKLLVSAKTNPIKPNEWFNYEVICKGNHIVIKVNGKTTVDFEDTNNTFKKGHFAFQQHNEGSVVKIRKVEVKELK